MRTRRLSTWALLAAFSLVALGSGDALAKGKKKKGPKKPAVVTKIDQRALGELMGEFTFGMQRKKVASILAKSIKERYREQIEATTDVYKQDKLRRDEKKEIAAIDKDFVEFTGKKTGWDVSIIDDQFGHNTSESMLVYWENVEGKDQRRFFFFHDGKLYKMFVALSSSMLKDEQRNFDFFKEIMQKRYGQGALVTETRKGAEVPVALEWQTPKYHVKAIDKLEFYGSFCLMVADPKAEKVVAAARESTAKPGKNDSVMRAVVTTPDDNEDPSLDSNSGAVDAILKN